MSHVNLVGTLRLFDDICPLHRQFFAKEQKKETWKRRGSLIKELGSKDMFNWLTSKTHPIPIPNAEDFSLKPIYPASFGLRQLDLLETIGTGSFGRVRLVKNVENKSYHALKIMKKAKIVRLNQFEHISNEIKILSHLRCSHVVTLDAFFQDDNNLYLLLEFVQGGELFSHLRKNEKFDDDVAKFFCVEVAVALNKMHSIQIAYRDIKPENIMLDSYGHIRLVDFGFAKIISDRTYTLCGTPEYLAPEVIGGDGYGCAVDWWALGVLLFEMVVGFPPFYDQNPFGVYKKILKGSIKFPTSSGVTSSAQSVIKGFLTLRRYRRLGCTSQIPIDSLKKHSYFQHIDWSSAEKMLITPPYLPTILSPGDTSNFDYYPEETIEEASNLSSTERIAFSELDLILDRPAGSSCK